MYSNQLFYTPEQNSYGIVRTSGAAITVECHYKRFVIQLYIYHYLYIILNLSVGLLLLYVFLIQHRTHFVSSINVRPSWEPFTSTKSSIELIRFSFQFMSGTSV